MQIIVPMSGFGERFRNAGYTVPKPLIKVDGKPIIAHVVDMFPGEPDFIFICNEDHLRNSDYCMQAAIRSACPTGRIVAIPPHRLGPIHAVMAAEDMIDPNLPTVVNYCDFTCYWAWHDFKAFVAETRCVGAIPAYRGFHPHSLGSTYYAYVNVDQAGWATDIQEKRPFTDTPMREFASSGTYYFGSARRMFEAFRATIAEDLRVNGEFYVSMAFKSLISAGHPVAVYELQHFMQWGTPEDLREYVRWSNLFGALCDRGRNASRQHSGAEHRGALLIPMAGLGVRFANEGYAVPKPFIEVAGVPMAARAALDMPRTEKTVFITRQGLGRDGAMDALRSHVPDSAVVTLDGPTEGQAHTCLLGLGAVDLDAPLSIAPCDSGCLFDDRAFAEVLAEADVLVWGARGHAAAARKPASYSWIDAAPDGRVRRVSLKQPLSSPGTDPIVIGAFTFQRASDFEAACKRLMASGLRVNNEFYADAVINTAIEMGLIVRMFEVDYYTGWGTPDELRTFCYWQSAFHKWASHPYRVDLDPRVPPSTVARLIDEYAEKRPARPEARPT